MLVKALQTSADQTEEQADAASHQAEVSTPATLTYVCAHILMLQSSLVPKKNLYVVGLAHDSAYFHCLITKPFESTGFRQSMTL
jgi:hypothetical protein